AGCVQPAESGDRDGPQHDKERDQPDRWHRAEPALRPGQREYGGVAVSAKERGIWCRNDVPESADDAAADSVLILRQVLKFWRSRVRGYGSGFDEPRTPELQTRTQPQSSRTDRTSEL